MTLTYADPILPLFHHQPTEKTTMNDQTPSQLGGLNGMQHDMLSRVLKALENLGVSYAVMLPDGSERKTGTYAAPPRERKRQVHRKGELMSVFIDYVKDLDIGGYAVIPRGNYPVESVRGALCGYASRNWGQGTYTTAVSADGENVEIIRNGGL